MDTSSKELALWAIAFGIASILANLSDTPCIGGTCLIIAIALAMVAGAYGAVEGGDNV